MPDKNISTKLAELSKRANAVRPDARLRHVPIEHDIRATSENARFMQPCQYQTILKLTIPLRYY